MLRVLGEVGHSEASNFFCGQFDSVHLPMVWFIELTPSLAIFFRVSIVGSVFVLLSSGLLGVWFGLECNFFGFIPLLYGKCSEEVERRMKYFLVQSLGSAIILIGVIIFITEFRWGQMSSWSMAMVLIIFGIFIKVGLFPFHAWFPRVMGTSSWLNCFMLSAWQKLGTMFFISGVGLSGYLMGLTVVRGLTTAFIGAVGGVGQVFYRALIRYSSFIHSGWMVLIRVTREIYLFFYFFLYSAISLFLFRLLHKLGGRGVGVGGSTGLSCPYLAWLWVVFNILSLAGLPPLVGAILKLLGIGAVCSFSFVSLVILLVCSVISLFYYLVIFCRVSFKRLSFAFESYSEEREIKCPVRRLANKITKTKEGFLTRARTLFLGLTSFFSVVF